MRVGFGVATLVFALSLGACERPARKAEAPVPQAVELPLIPRAALFGDPERTQARISPKGDFVSFLAPIDGRMNLFVAPVSDIAKSRPLTRDVGQGIHKHFWAETGAHLLFMQDKAGDENFRLYAVDVATGEVKDLTPLDGVSAKVVSMSPREPDVVLVGLNDRDPRWHDLYKINILTGKRALIERNTEGFARYYPDRDNVPRLATKFMPDGSVQLWRFNLQGRWSEMLTIPFEDSVTTMPLAFEQDGKTFLMLDSVGRDKAALVRVDAATAAKEVIGESGKADVSEVWIDPVTFAPQAFGVNYLKLERTGLTPGATRSLEFLRKTLKGETQVVSRSADDRKWIIVEMGPTTPAVSYLYDRDAETLTRLFDQRPALANAPLAAMVPVEIASRDGQTLVSYLTIPPGSDLDNNARPEKPTPLVLLVHGGPWWRDTFDFNAEHQWLANRGYAVLSVNFRGSTGFGKAFVNAGNREWGGKMQDDLLDAVDWAVKEGVTTPDRVAIMGGSYGGYAALAGLAFTPDRFACGVAFAAPANLETLLASTPAYWEAQRNDYYLRIGDPRTPEGQEFLRSRSPISRAGEIRRPLLLAHGLNDARVKPEESETIAEAMTKNALPIVHAVFADEGHGFGRAQNRRSFFALSEAFLSTCLGGRAEPFGEDLARSSLDVVRGAERVPDLTAALRQLGIVGQAPVAPDLDAAALQTPAGVMSPQPPQGRP
jgi:dipeptidyl aminopeptidase/acylaminoacyl peptidase